MTCGQPKGKKTVAKNTGDKEVEGPKVSIAKGDHGARLTATLTENGEREGKGEGEGEGTGDK